MTVQGAVFDPWRTAWAYAEALAATHAGAALWQAQRARRLAALLDHAQRHSPLYRERLARAGAASDPLLRLARMPPLRKREAVQRFAEWVTDPALDAVALQAFVHDRSRCGDAVLGRYLVWESSGSSGEPALFVQDAQALAVADALEAARGPVTLGTAAWEDLRIAFVGALGGHFASVVSFERARALNPWLAGRARGFSFLQPIAQLVAQLNDFAPTVLASYPSMAWVLAEERAAARLRVELKAVWTGGETLTPALRQGLSSRFGAPVRDSYGASECFLIASECRCGRLHLNADWVILEPVDARARPVPPGRFGATTLLTNLANFVQPIIRYDLGDRVRIVDGACACGSSLPVVEVHGRADDTLTLEDDLGHPVHLAPLALTTVLEDEAGVFDFQLRRRGPHSLRLDMFGDGAARHADDARRVLCAFLRSQGLASTQVQCRCGDAAARGRSGKQQRVVCQVHDQ